MGRAVYVYRPNHPKASRNGFVDTRDLYEEPPSLALDAPIMVGRFYENQRTVEGHDIGSRQKHREYMRQRGLTTADDYDKPGGEWDRAAAERARMSSGDFDHKDRREAIGRALYEVERKNGKRS